MFLSSEFLCCLGQITSPPDGTNMTVLPGSTVNITWTFKDKLSDVSFPEWRFTSSNGSFKGKVLATIHRGTLQIEDSGLSGVSVVEPATLLLRNVNQTYDGTYRFVLFSRFCVGSSEVVVFIASKL